MLTELQLDHPETSIFDQFYPFSEQAAVSTHYVLLVLLPGSG
jgi:hypothetical protein